MCNLNFSFSILSNSLCSKWKFNSFNSCLCNVFLSVSLFFNQRNEPQFSHDFKSDLLFYLNFEEKKLRKGINRFLLNSSVHVLMAGPTGLSYGREIPQNYSQLGSCPGDGLHTFFVQTFVNCFSPGADGLSSCHVAQVLDDYDSCRNCLYYFSVFGVLLLVYCGIWWSIDAEMLCLNELVCYRRHNYRLTFMPMSPKPH